MSLAYVILSAYNHGKVKLAETDAESLRNPFSKLGFVISSGVQSSPDRTLAAARKFKSQNPISLILFFSGHGYREGGEHYIQFKDCIKPLAWVEDQLIQCLPSLRRLIVICDACRNRDVAESNGSLERNQYITRPFHLEVAHIFSCEPDKFAHEQEGARHGYFVGAFISYLKRTTADNPMLLGNLPDNLEMPGGQRATVVGGEHLSLTDLVKPLYDPPHDDDSHSAISKLACAGHVSYCVTVKGNVAFSEEGRPWVDYKGVYKGADFASGYIAAYTDATFIISTPVRGGHTAQPVGVKDQHVDKRNHASPCSYVLSNCGQWIARIPNANSHLKTAIFHSSEIDYPIRELPRQGIRRLAFVKPPNVIVAADKDGDVLWLQDDETTVLCTSCRPMEIISSPCGKWVAWFNPSAVWLVDVKDVNNPGRPELYQFRSEGPGLRAVTSLGFSTDARIAIGHPEARVTLMNLKTQALKPLKPETEGIVTALAFTGDNKHLVVGTSRGQIRTLATVQTARSKEAGHA